MSYAAAVREALAAAADPAKAEGMRRYMKSELPFLGVAKPERAKLVRAAIAAHPCATKDEWLAEARDLWRGAAHREERYAATDLTGARRYAAWQTADVLPLYEEFIVTGAWWDHVDEVAANRVGPLLRAFPDQIGPVMRAWATDPDRWRRRTSVICQLTAKADLDTDLLTHAIESTQDDQDFFLRKAIGWALRQHARVDPDWVRAFVDAHPRLSPLSRREALKHLGVG
ncbi:DNA alkylation repair protein [Actinokineospora sp. G85]|uniref:DNA alkylation repair protein n=1 Tax=Actinokineospora sp. G85 TaxID=3406626 RepID=UPI003C75B45F